MQGKTFHVVQSHAFEFSETGVGGRVEVIGTLQENYIQVSFSLFLSELSENWSHMRS